MRQGRARLSVVACAIVAAVLIAACGSSSSSSSSSSAPAASTATSSTSSSGSSSSGGTIKIGAISDITGTGATFPQAAQAAAAYFKQLNQQGGINGKKVDYISLDSAGSSTTAAQDARQLVDQDHVAALVASTSVYDCPDNASFYAKNHVIDIVEGVLPQCFTSANIVPINDGLFEGTGVSLAYAVKTLHKTHPCVLYGNTPPEPALMQKVLANFTAQTGVKVTLQEQYPGSGTVNWESYILRASQAGCDAIVPAEAGPPLVAFEKQFTQLGMRSKMTDVELSSAYSTQIGQAIAPGANGVYADSEFLPFTGSGTTDPALKGFLATMKAGGVDPSAFAEGGYVSAQILTDVLKTIKGPITAATVTKALKASPPVHSPLMGNPFVIGSGSTHQGNYSSQIVQLRNGVWQPTGSGWTRLKVSQG